MPIVSSAAAIRSALRSRMFLRQSTSAPSADIFLIALQEGRLRALHVQQACAMGSQCIGAPILWRLIHRAAERLTRTLQTQEGDHVLLIHAVARDSNRSDQGRAAIDRHAARKDLQTIPDAGCSRARRAR